MSGFSAIASRLVSRFRLRNAMSLQDAANILGVPINADDDTIVKAYRKKFIENRSLHTDTGGSSEELVKLNVAKDTLLGKLRPDWGTPSYNKPPSSSPPPRREPPPPKKEVDVPQPEGESFKSAISKASSAQWFILTVGRTYQKATPDYTIYEKQFVLVGENGSHYLVMLLTRVRNASNTSRKTSWTSVLTSFPKDSKKFLKIAPKVVKELVDSTGNGYFNPQFKFHVLSDHSPSEEMFDIGDRGRLSLKDALLGSGLIQESENSELVGRKLQVEIKPKFNKERFLKLKSEGKHQNAYQAFDWTLFLNGKVRELTPDEVERLAQKHLLASLYNYDYAKENKVNLTRLRGGRLKYDAKSAIKVLADSLNSSVEKDLLEKLHETL